jgi:hypothetical protein
LPSVLDRFRGSDATIYAGPSEITPAYANKMLLAALQEAQSVVRSYDTKAQIVGVGYILALNLVLHFGDLLPTHAPLGPLFFAVVWGIVISPILQFGQVLYPSRTRAEKELRTKMTCGGFAERGYSPTALQSYARCPYRFFLQTIQGLSPREIAESIDELDPLQRGALIHDIQFAFFERLSARKLLPVTPATLSKAREILDDVIVEIATRYYDDLAPAIDRVWDDGIAAIQADLREWLRRASEDTSGYVPLYFEMSFGLAGRRKERPADPHSVSDPVDLDCGIQLRGSIDLVEPHPSGLMRVARRCNQCSMRWAGHGS